MGDFSHYQVFELSENKIMDISVPSNVTQPKEGSVIAIKEDEKITSNRGYRVERIVYNIKDNGEAITMLIVRKISDIFYI